MRIPSGVTDQYIYFLAVDATDLNTPETGLSSFTVYRSRNGGAAAAMTTPTINEVDATNMPGLYELLLDEDMTLDAGDDSQEMAFRITATGMAPVTRTIELYRPKVTAGNTLDVSAAGNAGIDLDNVALSNSCGPFAVAASGTLSGTHSATTADLGTNAPASGEVAGMTLRIPAKFFSRIVTSYNAGTGVASFESTAITLANGDQWYLMDTPDMPVAVQNELADSILTRQMTESYAADGTAPTLAQALMLIQQSVGDFSVSGTTLSVKGLDGTTVVATYTLDSATAPTSRTRAT